MPSLNIVGEEMEVGAQQEGLTRDYCKSEVIMGPGFQTKVVAAL
jgi:hypothetical protein